MAPGRSVESVESGVVPLLIRFMMTSLLRMMSVGARGAANPIYRAVEIGLQGALRFVRGAWKHL
jgi:hypothetical protein